ncbi:MAG: branched-chain-amino-acid transaminase [bacterium JZ-2024 1]
MSGKSEALVTEGIQASEEVKYAGEADTGMGEGKELEVFINGRYYPKSNAHISAYDHGLLYGDGVFEGIRVYNGRVFKLREHLDRLYRSARAIMIDIPYSYDELMYHTLETLRRNRLYDRAYIRLVVTRGQGDLGINPKKCRMGSTIIIITDTIQIYPAEAYEQGIATITCNTRKVSPDALPTEVKTLNYLSNILAIIEANNAGAAEGIMLDSNGWVTEATVDNIFIVRQRVVITPPVYLGILPGITRATVMDLARERGYAVIEQPFTTAHIYTSDEVFLTGTGAEVIPVVRVDNRIIGDGKPGPITKELITAFRELTQVEGEPIPV